MEVLGQFLRSLCKSFNAVLSGISEERIIELSHYSPPLESPEKTLLDRVTMKPKRTAIVRFIGERGEVSFKELKAKLGLGVGTLYYHLDGLADVVTQNKIRQYILTEEGKKVYESIKNAPQINERANYRGLFPRVSGAFREVLFFESHVERLSLDPMSNLSLSVAILVVGSVLTALTRVEPAIYFIGSRTAGPGFAAEVFLFSWLVVLAVCWLLSSGLWRAQKNFAGVAASAAFSFIPILFVIMLDGVRRTFALGFLTPLFSYPAFLVLQVLVVLWASYLLTISLMSSASLNLEKAMVVALAVVLINLGYLWARPLIFSGIH